jgi:hypothetical protein
VAARGSVELLIEIHSPLIDGAIEASFSSIGVFQELLKRICTEAGVPHHQRIKKQIADPAFLQKAIDTKTQTTRPGINGRLRQSQRDTRRGVQKATFRHCTYPTISSA